MKFHFIINPVAGDMISEDVLKIIDTYSQKHPEFNYSVQITQQARHGTELAKAVMTPGDVILSVGGDGSTFDVLNGLQPGVLLGVIPAGTGNDFVRMIGMDKKMTLEEIIVSTIEGKRVSIDCGVANGYKYINSLNVGLDVDVLLEYDRMRERRPWSAQLIYIMSAIKVLMRFRTFKSNWTIDGEGGPSELILMTMMNGKYYGGGFKPTPKASIQDGKLDVCFVEKLPFLKVLYLFVKYRSGTHQIDHRVHVRTFDKIVIDADEQFHFGCDGEVHQTNHLEIGIIKDALTLLVPQMSVLK